MFKISHIFPTWMPFAFMASYNAFEFTFFTSYALLERLQRASLMLRYATSLQKKYTLKS